MLFGSKVLVDASDGHSRISDRYVLSSFTTEKYLPRRGTVMEGLVEVAASVISEPAHHSDSA